MPTPRTSGDRVRPYWNIAYVLLILVALFWAGNAIVGRGVRDWIPPFTLAFGRWTGAFVLLLPFAWRHVMTDAAVLRAYWWQTLLLGLLGVAAFNALLYSALQYTTATNGLLIQAAIPLSIPLLAYVLFQERTAWLQVAAASISTIGVLIIIAHGDLDVLRNLDFGFGDVLVLIAVGCWSLYTVLLRWRPPVHQLSFLAATFLIAVVTMAPLALMEFYQGRHVVWRSESVLAFVYVATLPSLLAYQFYNRGVAMIGATRAVQFISLIPLFGAGLAVLLLGEPLAGYHIVGMVLILIGIIAFARLSTRETS